MKHSWIRVAGPITLFCFALSPAFAEVKKSTELLAVDDHSHAKSTAVQLSPKREYAFKPAGIFFSTAFEGSASSQITQIDPQTYQVQVTAENTPINDSAWYGFKFWSGKKSTVKKIKIILNYVGGTHRYLPKQSADRNIWVSLAADQIQINEAKTTATFELAVSTKPTWIAAQELFSTSDFKAWMKELTKNKHVKTSSIGKSILGRSIPQIEISDKKSGNPAEKKILLVFGRQHPPEVTGTLALQGFVNELAKNTEKSKRFREKFDVVVYPLINPDGVDEGFWRHNRNGFDLNRDWGPFKQPETRAVRDALAALKGRKIAFAIDFHSTFKDVFYTLEDSVPARAKHLVMDWITGLSKEVPDFTYRVQPVPYTVPGSCNWLNKEYGIATVVYEVGDSTDRAKVRQIAETGANVLTKLLLETPAEEWKQPPQPGVN